uniref:Uncharacterized protein n=1 Tax=Nothobranchius furzeri TaxID=105023 RepID=A0A8C6LK82_NOTFU
MVLFPLCVSEEQHKPEYYILRDKDDSPKLCLATEFTRQNATMDHLNDVRLIYFLKLTASPSAAGFQNAWMLQRARPLWNQVSVEPDPTVDIYLKCCFFFVYSELFLFVSDTMVNLATISISILRLIFIKTVVFNVLMTLRLWISQCEYRTSQNLTGAF